MGMNEADTRFHLIGPVLRNRGAHNIRANLEPDSQIAKMFAR